ncbi:bifunctional 3-phenylpropionate/cinnamic acid dioxygenase ferredoxin subunit [Allonocardiopsis opalescens]|uniref:3-phenylpropionate/trans-cinnamate dioxygenase ferredoxin subunit n=1 Tax=Allonocardiopsis opalescens TaxID=1144618 RepID=A0A2T0PZM1_9ACTN|nr:bifunctional 3-phenylpropionate/cinnamic acid dioxygenase ferredoxin subunit [Allonocardiopsis opalescens]PRX97001.1 3-phenylpropionate/trans-cinnamate dioxygenase ferredoxin subunit [Allonocardiopsis opalescens]
MDVTKQVGRRIRVCAVAELPDGEAVRIPREETGTGDAIAVFNDGGEFFALNDTCTHAQGSLAEGWVEDGEVECPVHSGVFCLRTGEALAMPASRDTVGHPVEVSGGEVWLMPGASS